MAFRINGEKLFFSFFVFSLSVRPLFSLFGLSVPPSYFIAPLIVAFFSRDFKIKNQYMFYICTMAAFLLFQAISVFWSFNQQVSIKYSFHIPFLLLIFLLAFSMFRDAKRLENNLRSATYMVFIINAIMLSVHLYCIFLGVGREGDIILFSLVEKGIYRYLGANSDPNFQAFYLLFFIGVCLQLKVKYRFLITLTLSAALLATLSRSGIAAYFACLFIWFLFKRRFFSLVATSGSFFLGYLFFSGSLYIEKRMSGIETGAGRFQLWGEAIRIFNESPLWGHGFGAYMSLLQSRGLGGHFAHNTFLEIMVSSGVLGLFFLVIYFSSVFCLFLIKGNGFKDGCFAAISALGMALTLSSFINPFFYFLMAITVCILLNQIVSNEKTV
ncbi:O-antigen ligase family protein [Alloalcanivorax xenomutans]|uniref:O-antigen ligase family protein n=1 Tax=Alloalcanivorax xenomutans TaxID=1094342 RepID=UPI00300A27F4